MNMKKTSFLFPILAVLAAVSCQVNSPDPLTGLFSIEEPGFTSATVEAAKIDNTLRQQDVTLTGKSTAVLSFCSKGWELPAATYNLASGLTAAGTYLGTVNGSAILSGNITVERDEEGVYTFSGAVRTKDDTYCRISYTGVLDFGEEPADPEPPHPTRLTKALVAYASSDNLITMSLGTEGVDAYYDASIWSMVYTGSGNYLALDIYTPDGFLHEGTYHPSAQGGAVTEGTYGIGYDTEMWGMTFYNWGTCWWTVENGATSAEKITSGDVTVTRSGEVWTITYGKEGDELWLEFSGELKDITGTGGTDDDTVVLGSFISLTDYFTLYQNPLVGMELGTPGFTYTSEFDWSTWTQNTTYSGDGNYLKLELYSADGSVSPGTYTACAEGGVLSEGEFGIGYDGQWGPSGSAWYTVTDNVATYEYITDGTAVVSVDGDVYTITLSSSTVNASYTGKLSAE